MAIYYIVGLLAAALIVTAWRGLYPKPYPGIPYNARSANRIVGDIPDLVPVLEKEKQFSHSILTITTRKLGSPIAQMLFPGFRKPLIVIEDPREIEDIIARRNKEFDKAPMAIDLFQPMFSGATNGQYTTPELKAQKRLWADVMSTEFLHKAAAPNIYKATLELLDLWRLKCSPAASGDRPFDVHEDFSNAALDAIWVAVVGEEPGVTRYEMAKIQHGIDGESWDQPLPRGAFLKEELAYIADAIARNSNTPVPKWAQKIETWTPRYRRFRARVNTELRKIMTKAVDRFQRIEISALESDESDTCMMDLVLRRQVVEARKAKRTMTDPTKDQNMLDEMFVMLLGGTDSTANTLTWFTRYMEAFPAVQTTLRAALRTAFPGATPQNQPTFQEILEADCPYLDAAVEEGLRLSGVAKANLRQAIVDTKILGYDVPKGAEIFMNFHIDRTPMPVDEERRSSTSRAAVEKRGGDGFRGQAGRDLDRFEPTRWLVTDPKTGKDKFDPYVLPSLAFGGGYRGCSGRKLATMEFRMVVVLLVLNLEFLELPEEHKSMSATEKIFRSADHPFARIKVL